MRSAAFLAIVLFAVPVAAQNNVLLIIADDMGVDRLAAYGEHVDPGNTPVLDQLAANGMLFRNAWANPVCSASRAAILTGQHSFRTGVGRGIGYYGETYELDVDTPSLADALPGSYASVALGKWHIGSLSISALDHPTLMGFDSHYGAPATIPTPHPFETYFNFYKNDNGTPGWSTTYATTDTVDDAITQVTTLPEPWFLWTAFNAPHNPWHAPPSGLHSFNLTGLPENSIVDHVKASIEAMDTEIGRLIAAMDPGVAANTVIIFVGDNGTDRPASTAPFIPTHAKSTVYEGGINVPLIVQGPGVMGGTESDGLVHIVDLFRTVTDIAGGDGEAAVDSVSLVPYFNDPTRESLRTWVYADIFEPNGFGPKTSWDRAARNERHKVIVRVDEFGDTVEELYDLDLDPFETTDLTVGVLTTEEQNALDDLSFKIESLGRAWTDLGFGLPGTNGVPQLLGSGDLVGGDIIRVKMREARGNAPAFLFLGLEPLYFSPFFGGTLVPDLTTLPGTIVIVQSNPFGIVNLASLWPIGIPSGFEIYLQYWVQDIMAPHGYAGTNAVMAVTP